MPGDDGRDVELRFAGLLPGSIFQRQLLVSEGSFRRLYPQMTLPSYFLIATPPGRETAVADVLRRNLGELGLEVRATSEVLDGFMRVQNTYLSMFLALGGLGLLLGTVGVVAVMLRSIMERRSELALMLATGFGRGRVLLLLLSENAGLLVTGVALGTGAALIAVLPQLLSVDSNANWSVLSGVLSGIILFGIVTSAIAVSGSVRGSLIQALRQE